MTLVKLAFDWAGKRLRSTAPASVGSLIADSTSLIRASYCATRLNASTASAKRVFAESAPSLASSSASRVPYCAGSVATATKAKFLAAARSIAGPPMSMFSTMSANFAAGSADTFSNGYRLSTSRSIGSMPCSAITASSVPRRPSRPPCTFGCRVLTRPSMISGKPVTSETSRTGSPASRMARAVPPVESSSMLRAARARARSISPVLSDTDSSARRTGSRLVVMASAQAVFAQLPAQGGAVDAQHPGGAALVAVAVVEHLHEQRDLELAQGDLVEIVGAAAVEVAQVAPHRPGDVVAQGRPLAGAMGGIGAFGGVQRFFPVLLAAPVANDCSRQVCGRGATGGLRVYRAAAAGANARRAETAALSGTGS